MQIIELKPIPQSSSGVVFKKITVLQSVLQWL